MIIETRAYARAGLLGNPSDGYFGKTISIIVRNFGAVVTLYESPTLVIEEQEEDTNRFSSIYRLSEQVSLTGYYGGARLLKAAIKKFCDYCEKNQIRLDNKNFTLRYQSSIPRQVGLAGSSAIITATIKALMQFYRVTIPQPLLPTLILEVEKEELGINAGLQDRVIQVYEGCVYMDFNKETMAKHHHGIYVPLDPNKLPRLYIAYKTQLGKESGKTFNDIRQRYDQGDEQVHSVMAELAGLAEKGKEAIEGGNTEILPELINRNFDLRCSIMNISESNREMVRVARECGASAKFSGSGGAIIGTYGSDDVLRKLINRLKEIDARVIKPYTV
jgi:glucuronokinase